MMNHDERHFCRGIPANRCPHLGADRRTLVWVNFELRDLRTDKNMHAIEGDHFMAKMLDCAPSLQDYATKGNFACRAAEYENDQSKAPWDPAIRDLPEARVSIRSLKTEATTFLIRHA